MKTVLVHQQETRVKHNMLLESTYSEFKDVHERKVMVENQFMKIGERLYNHDQKFNRVEAYCGDLSNTTQSLTSDMLLAKQAIDHVDNQAKVRMVEMMESVQMTKAEFEKFTFNVTAKGSYLEDKYVPQALEAMQNKVGMVFSNGYRWEFHRASSLFQMLG